MHSRSTPAVSARLCLQALCGTLLLLLSAGASTAEAQSPTPTRVSLASTPAGAALSASIQTTTGTPVTSGTVDFLLPSGESLGSALVSADGTATLLPASLPAGTPGVTGSPTLGITAVYHATAASLADSRSVTQSIAAPAVTNQAPDYAVTGNPTTVTTARGAYGTTILTVSSIGGYTGAIQFSCGTLPSQVSCVFNPAQQNLAANGSFTSTLQMQTQGPEGRQAALQNPHTGLALALAVPGAFAIFGLSRRRRSLFAVRMVGVLLLFAGAGLGLMGCSQRYSYLNRPPPVAGGTAPGTYTITVAVTGDQGSAVLQRNLDISLVVQ